MNTSRSLKTQNTLLIVLLLSLGYLGAVFTNLQAQPYDDDPTTTPTNDIEGTPPAVSSCLSETRLTVNAQARVASSKLSRFRTEPSPNAQVISILPSGTEFVLVSGPICNDDVIWWQINHEGTIGWTPEKVGRSYYVEPIERNEILVTPYIACHNAPLSNIVIGSIIQITDEHGLRDIGFTMNFGERTWNYEIDHPYEVLDGPVCRDRSAFWKIETYPGHFIWVREAYGWTVFLLPYENNSNSMRLPTATPTPFVEIAVTPYSACPNAPISNIVIGSIIQITDEHGRREIGRSADFTNRVFDYEIGRPYEVLDGPFCRENSVFWKIEASPRYFIWVREAYNSSVFLLPYKSEANLIPLPTQTPTPRG